MSVSNRVKKGMELGSWIRRMFDEGTAMKKKVGAENVFDLSLGNPIMEPPPEFKREIKRLADNPFAGLLFAVNLMLYRYLETEIHYSGI